MSFGEAFVANLAAKKSNALLAEGSAGCDVSSATNPIILAFGIRAKMS